VSWVERYEGRRPLGRPGAWWITLKRIFRMWDVGWVDGIDCIELAQDRDRWQALVNAVMNFQFP